MRALLRWAREWVDLEKGTLDEALRRAAPTATGRLLDVGCGDKPYEHLFRPYVTAHEGVDFAPTFQDSENARINRADRIYSGSELPYDSESFETVLCTQVLEHAPDPKALLLECARVLRPGGHLILTVPFAFRIHSEPHDYFRFTRYGLRSMTEAGGLEVERLEARGGAWLVLGQKLASLLALRWGRLGAQVQQAGGLTYERPIRLRPRYWALPIVVPAIVLVVALARLLEHLDHDPSDTLGYLLIARKPR
ncbi:MAG TPA: class I SAM-dependent methyltransferase [Holophagaceae bacterium]|nr:class I SAM-dependent methyltransferase [Holophagaceae bacterium]